MSHITEVKTEIKDINQLSNAATQCGCELIPATTFKYFAGNTESCEFLIRDREGKATYEIGIVRDEKTGGYSLKLDSFQNMGGLADKVGYNADTLLQRYSLMVAQKTLRAQGFAIQEKVLEDGTVQLRAYK